jgi:hypothetical protein
MGTNDNEMEHDSGSRDENSAADQGNYGKGKTEK